MGLSNGKLKEIGKSTENGRTVNLTSRHRRRDGSLRDVEATVFVTEHAGRAMFVVEAKDVTERNLAQREARHQQSLLLSLINSIPDPIFFKDLQGRYLGCNDALVKRFGKSHGEICGRTADELYSRERAGQIRLRDERTLASAGPIVTEEGMRHVDGTFVMYETLTAPLLDKAGRPQGLLGIARDITERKRHEETLRAGDGDRRGRHPLQVRIPRQHEP